VSSFSSVVLHAGSTGGFTIRLLLNAAIEAEHHVGPANDVPAAAEDINSSFIDLGAPGAERAAVVGQVGGPPAGLFGADGPGANFVLVDRATGAPTVVATNVGNGQGYAELAYNPVTQIMYASQYGGDDLYTVDLQTGQETLVAETSFSPIQGMAWSPDGTTLFATSGTLYGTVDVVSGTFTPFLDYAVIGMGEFGALAVTPDGFAVATTIFQGGPILLGLIAATGSPFNIQQISAPLGSLARFPDGTVLGGTITVDGGALIEIEPEGGILGDYTPGSDQGTGLAFVDGVSDPEDFYHFDLQADDVVTLVVTGITDGQLELLDASGTVLASGSAGPANVDLVIESFAVSATGTYYARVANAGDFLDYSLVLTRNAAFDLEDNNDAGNAQELGDNQGVLGHLGADGADYYSIDVASGETIDLSTLTPSGGPFEFVNNFDPAIQLIDPTGASVAMDDNSAADGRNVLLSHTAALTGTYIVAVTGAGSTTGEYVLSVAVEGDVEPTPAAVLIVDNTPNNAPWPANPENTSYATTGSVGLWVQGFQNDVHEALSGGVVETATYSFNNLTPGDVYQVATTWTPFSNRAANAPYAVSGVTNPATIRVNQRSAPNDFTDQGAAWEILGTFTVDPAGTLQVVVSGSTSGNVIFDAVRAARVSGPAAAVFDDTGGTGVVNGSTVDLGTTLTNAAATRSFTISNPGTQTLTLGTPLFSTGDFEIVGAFPTSVDAGMSESFVVGVSNTSAPGSFTDTLSFTTNGSNQNPFVINIAATVIAALVVDDGDPEYSESIKIPRWQQGFQNDVREATLADVRPMSATYTFADLPAGTYRVSATWTPFTNRATNSPFTINGGTPIQVNQKLSPSNSASTPAGTSVVHGGSTFADLDGNFSFGGGTLTVGLSDSGVNGNVIFDAVRVELLGPPNAGASLEALPTGGELNSFRTVADQLWSDFDMRGPLLDGSDADDPDLAESSDSSENDVHLGPNGPLSVRDEADRTASDRRLFFSTHEDEEQATDDFFAGLDPLADELQFGVR